SAAQSDAAAAMPGLQYQYSCSNDATALSAKSGSASSSCTFGDNGTYTVLARISDKDTGYRDYTTVVTVNNVAPTATLGNNGPVNEGGPVTICFPNPSDVTGD